MRDTSRTTSAPPEQLSSPRTEDSCGPVSSAAQRRSQARGRTADQHSHQVRGRFRYKSGTSRATRHCPTLTNITRRSCRPPASLTLRPWSAFSQLRYISKRSPVHTKHALAGRADLRDGRHKRQACSSRGSGVWHSADLPEGYHAAPRGQAWEARPVVGRDAAPGEPRGRAKPGRRDAARLPAFKIISGCRLSEASGWWTDQDQAVSRP